MYFTAASVFLWFFSATCNIYVSLTGVTISNAVVASK